MLKIREEEQKILEEFLVDAEIDSQMLEIEKSCKGVNVFSVLGLENHEIRHSNMLAWLLDPNESHGFDDRILRSLLMKLVRDSADGIQSISAIEFVKLEVDSALIRREALANIDLLIEIKRDVDRFVVCIENKIWAGEGVSTGYKSQLDKYHEAVCKEYGEGAVKLFVFLTPDGAEASEEADTRDMWQTLSYQDVAEIIEQELENAEGICDEARLLTRNYLDVIRRNIVGNTELERLCTDIYKKRKAAFDLIFDNIIDPTYERAEIIKECIEEVREEFGIEHDDKYSTKSLIRFRTNALTEVFPEVPTEKSAWKSFPYNAMYEVYNRKGLLGIYFSACATKETTEEERNEIEKIMKTVFDKNPASKRNWVWTGKTLVNISDPDALDGDETRDVVLKMLRECLEKYEEKLRAYAAGNK